MNKRVGVLLALGLLLVVPGAVRAENPIVGTLPPSQYPFETTVVTTHTSSVGTFGPGTVIYGFKLLADDAGDACGLYDTALYTSAATTQGIFIDELQEDTDNRMVESHWPAPYVLTTDLSVLTNGLCIIYHSPQ